MSHVRNIALLSTGGTIEKTYSESDGTISNQRSVLEMMLAGLILHGVRITRISLMNKDSLLMTAGDHVAIGDAAESALERHDGVVITHGTDRLQHSGEYLAQRFGDAPARPIILTGAMRPYELRTTDALQNLTEALLAVQLVIPGVYVAMHNEVLRFPGVVKDTLRMRFVRQP